MIDILTFLKEDYPEVFAKTRYTIVEISEALAARQRGRAREAGFLVEEDGDEAQGVTDEMGKVRVINKDWFEWEGGGEESCYLVALEVFVSGFVWPPGNCMRLLLFSELISLVFLLGSHSAGQFRSRHDSL